MSWINDKTTLVCLKYGWNILCTCHRPFFLRIWSRKFQSCLSLSLLGHSFFRLYMWKCLPYKSSSYPSFDFDPSQIFRRTRLLFHCSSFSPLASRDNPVEGTIDQTSNQVPASYQIMINPTSHLPSRSQNILQDSELQFISLGFQREMFVGTSHKHQSSQALLAS